jgi:S-adenosylmethionine:tRNA ribosyltransferase-isomerase
MFVSDFDFHLPDELIAQEAAPRGASRLLVVDRETGAIEHATISDLPRFLRPDDVLVVNNTRVFAARLLGHRVPSGGAVECLLLSLPAPLPDASVECEALMHPGQKLKPGETVEFDGRAGTLRCEVIERRFFGRRRIRLTVERVSDGGAARVDDLVDALGHIPLPPYIKRADTPADRDRYQTVFAQHRGSVAAPTAGLHFTPELLRSLDSAGIERVEITLHVGYGTFKPVRAERVEDHVVDPEQYEIELRVAELLNRAHAENRRIIAVGTTTTRALEDASARGQGLVAAGAADATTFIFPGFHFQVVGGLLTNFHLPRSSLLMLVAAFAGREKVLNAYREAIAKRYRFYSYGDAMLIA